MGDHDLSAFHRPTLSFSNRTRFGKVETESDYRMVRMFYVFGAALHIKKHFNSCFGLNNMIFLSSEYHFSLDIAIDILLLSAYNNLIVVHFICLGYE